MANGYKINIDGSTLIRILSVKPKCKKCNCKLKIYRKKIFKYHGNHEIKGYIKSTDKGPISWVKEKQIFFNQDIYEIIYKYKCPQCESIYDLEEY